MATDSPAMPLRGLLGLLAAILVALVFAPAADASAVAYTTTPYNTPGITTDSSGATDISVVSPPGGLYYTATGLDPTHTYRATLSGQAVSGGWSARLRTSSGSVAYRSAPNGSETYQVTGTTSYEVLVYTGAAGQYDVQSFGIDDCSGSCKTDSDLKQQILSDTPGLSDALAAGDSWTAAKLIRGWVAPRIPWAGSGDAQMNTAGLDPAQIYYEDFQPLKYGVYCGGASDFLRGVLNAFGINAFRFDFGTAAQDLTHATVLIPYPNPNQMGGTDYRIIDPTFNMDWTVTTSGNPVSVPAAWELWRAGDTSNVGVNKGDLSSRTVLVDSSTPGQFTQTPCSSIPSFNGCSFDSYLAYYAPTFAADGLQTGFPGFLQLMGTGKVFYPSLNGTPSAFVNTQSTFANAVANNQTSTHVAYLPLPPQNTAAPQVTGDAAVGTQMSVSTGAWSNSTPSDSIDSYGYQWSSCDSAGANCQPISGQTSSTYTPVDADQGHVLQLAVTAHNQEGWSNAATVSTAAVGPREIPANTSAPSISGTAQDGQQLQAQNGSWAGAQPLTYGYQWLRCQPNGGTCQTLSGQTGQAYQLTSSDVGSQMVVQVTGTNSYGTATAQSQPTATVQAAPPVDATPPGLTGTTQDGQVLYSGASTWTGTQPFTYSYQWQRCSSDGSGCQSISGATSDRYRETTTDIGKRLMMILTAKNSAGQGSTQTPLSSVIQPGPPNPLTAPTMTGTAQDGQVLYSVNGSWAGTQPWTYSYQWQRCDTNGTNCQAISGATSDRYRNTSADVGSRIRYTMTAASSYGQATIQSVASAIIQGAPPANIKPPTVTGGTTVGSLLGPGTRGQWSGTTPLAWSYQWDRCSSSGTSCQHIPYATTYNYRVTSADVGSTIVLELTATNPYGSATANSAPYGPITSS